MNCQLIGRGRWGQTLAPYIHEFFNLINISGRDYTILPKSRAVFIATPHDTHYDIAKDALQAGKHIFCEKPLTTDYSQARELVIIAKKNNLVLFTDYTEMYAPSRIKMRELFPDIGPITNFWGITNNTLADLSGSTLWHLHCHHLSMASLFVPIQKFKYEYAHDEITCRYKDIIGSIKCVKGAQFPLKKFTLYGERGILEYDYYSEYISLNDKKYHHDEKNNLIYAVRQFKNCIEKKEPSNIKVSLQITKIIEGLLK